MQTRTSPESPATPNDCIAHKAGNAKAQLMARIALAEEERRSNNSFNAFEALSAIKKRYGLPDNEDV